MSRPVHRLTPLLALRSIAYVGATQREGAPGNDVLEIVRRGGFEGDAPTRVPMH